MPDAPAPQRPAAPARMWGGRFGADGGSDPAFRALGDSLRFDWRLVRDDIVASAAWARALRAAGVLSADEQASIVRALDNILSDASSPAPPPGADAEDVHSWVESRLVAAVGDAGKKLHTGRSRNDQVATDLRLWIRREIASRRAELHALRSALVRLAHRESGTPFPGYTHLQRAQPILFAHWCLSHFEALSRDDARLADAATRAAECPLGSGALAGTAYAIDRPALARGLGFDAASANSLDAVGDRDFVAETLASLALAAVHLSRLAEDLVIYSSAEFGLIELGDAVTSGSSLMPQKKNPDVAELVRGKCGRVVGALVALLTTLKAAPASYNRDFQEDKEPLFDAMETVSLCLRSLVPAIDSIRVHRDAASRAAAGGHSNATELADYLVDRGVAFRDAHEIAGKAVRLALDRGVNLLDLPLPDLQRLSPSIGADVHQRLTVDAAIARRDALGGTSERRVALAATRALRRLQASGPLSPDLPAIIRRASLDDAAGIARVINLWAEKGLTLRRSPADIAAHVRDFSVAISAPATPAAVGAPADGVVGCGALVLAPGGLAEIRSLAVDPDNAGKGVGTAIVRRLCADALALGAQRVFVLSCSPAFFERVGFAPVTAESLGEAGKAAWARRDRSTAQWSFLAWEPGA